MYHQTPEEADRSALSSPSPFDLKEAITLYPSPSKDFITFIEILSSQQPERPTASEKEIRKKRSDLSWLVGFMAWKGSIPNSRSNLMIAESNKNKRKLLKDSLTTILGIEVEEITKKRGNEPYTTLIKIRQPDDEESIGDLTKNIKQTLKDRYPWIGKEEEYSKAFLSGILDSKSYIAHNRIQFFIPNQEDAEYIQDLIKKLEVNAIIESFGKGFKVSVFKKMEMRNLATLLKPRLKETRKKLSSHKKNTIIKTPPKSEIKIPTNDLLRELTSIDFSQSKKSQFSFLHTLGKRGALKYSTSAYQQRFGKSYQEAKQNLSLFLQLLHGYRRHTKKKDLSNKELEALHQAALHFEPHISIEETITILSSKIQNNGETCLHRWSIGEQNGPTSMGTCRKCGAMKEFKNSERKVNFIGRKKE